MTRKINNPLEIKDELLQDLNAAFGNNLLCAAIFGSAASPRYVPGRSDINIVLVMNSDSILSLKPLNRMERKWLKRRVVFSFFFTPEELRTSLDVFPLEFLGIRREHIVLTGTDYFQDLKINPALLRLQCERDLKGGLIHLKREFIRWHHKKKALAELARISFTRFLIIFRGILFAAGAEETPQEARNLCAALGKILGISVPALERIAAGNVPMDLSGLVGFYPEYVSAIEEAARSIDRLTVTDKINAE
jgi:predicted nucleotidyltransferase